MKVRMPNPVMNARQGIGFDALVGRFVVAAPALADGIPVSSLSASSVEYAARNEAPRDIAPYVRHMEALINEYRKRNGLGTLKLVPDPNMISWSIPRGWLLFSA